MDPVTGGLLLGGVGAGLSYFGQQSANNKNLAFGREQMEWQERMMNSAHTREVADLRNAGLNPILSAGGGGASSPSGVSVDQQNAVPDLGGMASTALQADRLREEIEGIRANVDKTKQDTKTSAAAEKLHQASALKTGAEAARSLVISDVINWAKNGGAKIMDKFGLSKTNAADTLKEITEPNMWFGPPPHKVFNERRKH